VLADLGPPPVDSSAQGNLIASTTFGGQSCVAASVDSIYFTLRDASGKVAGYGSNDATAPCVDTNGTLGGSHYFSAIPPGTYWLEVTGLSSAGPTPAATYYVTGQVTVSPGYTASASADASPPP